MGLIKFHYYLHHHYKKSFVQRSNSEKTRILLPKAHKNNTTDGFPHKRKSISLTIISRAIIFIASQIILYPTASLATEDNFFFKLAQETTEQEENINQKKKPPSKEESKTFDRSAPRSNSNDQSIFPKNTPISATASFLKDVASDTNDKTTSKKNTTNAATEAFFKDAAYDKFGPQEDSRAFDSSYLEGET